MNIYIDYAKRMQRIREEMGKAGIDVLIGTRIKAVTYVAGAFVPWRSVVLVSRDGYEGLVTMLIDLERMKNESWLPNITAYAPVPGFDLWDVVIGQIRQRGWEKAAIGLELGHSPRGNSGFLFATEYDLLRAALPEARFVNALAVLDRATFIKDASEIKLLRQAAAMTDAAMERITEELYIGMSETEIAGIGEMELRRLGSEYHWAVTGSSEIASGYRTAYNMNGTTPASTKLIQRGDNLIVDLHASWQQYYADLAHNRTSDYIFSYDKMLATKGNTATYMQYAYARVRSIFRKGDIDVDALRNSPTAKIIFTHASERSLAIGLLAIEEALESLVAGYLPHHLTAYLFELASRYSTFYQECDVLKAEDESTRNSRLLLCDLTARTLKLGLSLLGIETVEKM